MRQARVLYLVSACVLSFGMTTSSYSQDLSAEDLSAIYKWSAEDNFAKHVANRFSGFPNFNNLRFDRASSLIAIPLDKSPATSIAVLAKESHIVGAIYFSSGSTRFRIGPGIYLVSIEFDFDKFSWIVTFLNKDQKPAARPVLAQVKEVEKTEFPVAYVDRSVCFRADKWDICF